MVKQNIKLKVPANQYKKFKEFQDICFKVGVYWKVSENVPFSCTGTSDMLITITNEEINYVMTIELFDATSFEEVDIDLFIRTDGTCKEVKHKNAKEYLASEGIYEQLLSNVKNESITINRVDKKTILNYLLSVHQFDSIFCWTDGKEGWKFWQHHNKNLVELKLEKAITEIKEDIKTMFEEVLKLTPEQYTELHKMPIRDDAEVFAKYGFEVPEFDCKLYDKIDGEIFGAVRHEHSGTWSLCKWGKNGNNGNVSRLYDIYELTPTKKPWYETCNYPAVIKSIKTGDMVLADDYKNGKIFYYGRTQYILIDDLQWVLVTNEEIEALKQ